MAATEIHTLLRVDSSARHAESVSRAIGDEVVRRLRRRQPAMQVVQRDLAESPLPHIDGAWVEANLTPSEQRSTAQQARLAVSDQEVALLQAADAVLVTAPIYNFSVPSALKAWIDHVCRAGLSFRYTAQGPQGLLEDRSVYLAMASGGVPLGAPADFASPYLRQVMRFVGIEDVRLLGAERVAADPAAATAAALNQLDQWLPEEPTGQAA